MTRVGWVVLLLAAALVGCKGTLARRPPAGSVDSTLDVTDYLRVTRVAVAGHWYVVATSYVYGGSAVAIVAEPAGNPERTEP